MPPEGGPDQPGTAFYANPAWIPAADHHFVWESVVDVIDDYFARFEREEPVRLIGNTLTEGRLDTFPEVSRTLFEPWRGDVGGGRERLESTLQSMRRRAVVRVIPAQQGFWVDVAVLKELEDVARPEHATAGAATFRYDDSLTRVVKPVGGQEVRQGWIPKGRDTALEQRILGRLQQRCGRLGCRLVPPMQNTAPAAGGVGGWSIGGEPGPMVKGRSEIAHRQRSTLDDR